MFYGYIIKSLYITLPKTQNEIIIILKATDKKNIYKVDNNRSLIKYR